MEDAGSDWTLLVSLHSTPPVTDQVLVDSQVLVPYLIGAKRFQDRDRQVTSKLCLEQSGNVSPVRISSIRSGGRAGRNSSRRGCWGQALTSINGCICSPCVITLVTTAKSQETGREVSSYLHAKPSIWIQSSSILRYQASVSQVEQKLCYHSFCAKVPLQSYFELKLNVVLALSNRSSLEINDWIWQRAENRQDHANKSVSFLTTLTPCHP